MAVKRILLLVVVHAVEKDSRGRAVRIFRSSVCTVGCHELFRVSASTEASFGRSGVQAVRPCSARPGQLADRAGALSTSGWCCRTRASSPAYAGLAGEHRSAAAVGLHRPGPLPSPSCQARTCMAPSGRGSGRLRRGGNLGWSETRSGPQDLSDANGASHSCPSRAHRSRVASHLG